MAEDTVDEALAQLGRRAKCRTRSLPLRGAVGFREPAPTAPEAHLARRFGAATGEIEALIEADATLGDALVPGLPYLRAEAVYAVRHEMARGLDDVLSRRTRARLFDRDASVDAAPAVGDLIGRELGWTADEIAAQVDSYRVSCAHEAESGRVAAPVAESA
jgi:glycerol-3-phosphate dehydrogenase